LLSRPPDRSGLDNLTLRTVNRSVLATVSHEWTTFPSGHVAVSWAVALAVARVSASGGIFLSLIALGVSIGAAAGRYHYVVDVLLGVVVALAAVVVT
jgi:membrane-associated phospholipid phosphatase